MDMVSQFLAVIVVSIQLRLHLCLVVIIISFTMMNFKIVMVVHKATPIKEEEVVAN